MAEQSHHPQARRAFILVAAAGLGLALAGCQIVPKPRPEAPPEPVRPPPVEAQPQPESNLPSDATRNRVAVLVPLSGANAGVGQSIANAANLALLDTGGERIRITVYDTGKGVQAAAIQAITDGNRLFLGPLLAEDVRTIAPIARRAGVPVIAFSNDTSIAGDGVYLLGFTPGQSVSRVVGFAHGRGLTRFAALTPEGVYGRRAAQAMIGAVESAGGRLIGMQSFDRNPASIKAALARLNGQGAYDAVLVADSGRNSAGVAPLIRVGAPSAKMLGTELWSTEADLGRTPALRGAWYAGPSDAMFNQLRSRYRARYGVNPYRLASLGYDAVLLAVRIGKDWRIGRPFPQVELRDPGGFAGVDGAFRFGSDGIAQHSLEVREVSATGSTVVSPAAKGFD